MKEKPTMHTPPPTISTDDFARLCESIRAAGLDPIVVLRDGGGAAREAADEVRYEHPTLAAALGFWSVGLAEDHRAYQLPPGRADRLDGHTRGRQFYRLGCDALRGLAKAVRP